MGLYATTRDCIPPAAGKERMHLSATANNITLCRPGASRAVLHPLLRLLQSEIMTSDDDEDDGPPPPEGGLLAFSEFSISSKLTNVDKLPVDQRTCVAVVRAAFVRILLRIRCRAPDQRGQIRRALWYTCVTLVVHVALGGGGGRAWDWVTPLSSQSTGVCGCKRGLWCVWSALAAWPLSARLSLRCLVCHDEFKEGQITRRLNCCHMFHQECVDRYAVRRVPHAARLVWNTCGHLRVIQRSA